MRPTPAGERMLTWARRLLDHAEQARREVVQERPALRLGALEIIAVTHVPALLARLAERRPDLLVNVPACSFWLAGQRLLGADVERVRAGGMAVMTAWAQQGLGLALLPEFAVTGALAAGSLERLPLDLPGLTLRLVWRPDREAVPGLRDVLYAASA